MTDFGAHDSYNVSDFGQLYDYGRPNREHQAEIAQRFLASKRGQQVAVCATPAGSLGACQDASILFAQWLESQGTSNVQMYRLDGCLRDYSSRTHGQWKACPREDWLHFVVQIGTTVWDWTSPQLASDAPWPHVFHEEQLHAEWNKITRVPPRAWRTWVASITPATRIGAGRFNREPYRALVATDYYGSRRARRVAIDLKVPTPSSIKIASKGLAEVLFRQGVKNPILVPVPASSGSLVANTALARATAARLHARWKGRRGADRRAYVERVVVPGLERLTPVSPGHLRRRAGQTHLTRDDHDFEWGGPRVDVSRVYLVDNVLTSGATMLAAQGATGGGTPLVWARSYDKDWKRAPRGRGARWRGPGERLVIQGETINLEHSVAHYFVGSPRGQMADAVNLVLGDLNALRFPLTVWRGLMLAPGEKIRRKGLGQGDCWADNRHSAEAFGATMLQGTIAKASDVDWEATLAARVRHDVLGEEAGSLDSDRPEREVVPHSTGTAETLVRGIKRVKGKGRGAADEPVRLGKPSPWTFKHKPLSVRRKHWLDSRPPYKGSPPYMAARRLLVDGLLSFGGERVLVRDYEEDLAKIVKRGYLRPGDPHRFAEGDTSRCHGNTACMWDAAEAWGGGFKIVTGYALSPDGLWRQHTWGLENGVPVETTVPRTAYFGFELTDDESRQFYEDNY